MSLERVKKGGRGGAFLTARLAFAGQSLILRKGAPSRICICGGCVLIDADVRKWMFLLVVFWEGMEVWRYAALLLLLLRVLPIVGFATQVGDVEPALAHWLAGWITREIDCPRLRKPRCSVTGDRGDLEQTARY